MRHIFKWPSILLLTIFIACKTTKTNSETISEDTVEESAVVNSDKDNGMSQKKSITDDATDLDAQNALTTKLKELKYKRTQLNRKSRTMTASPEKTAIVKEMDRLSKQILELKRTLGR